jgi:hypothetical protein
VSVVCDDLIAQSLHRAFHLLFCFFVLCVRFCICAYWLRQILSLITLCMYRLSVRLCMCMCSIWSFVFHIVLYNGSTHLSFNNDFFFID